MRGEADSIKCLKELLESKQHLSQALEISIRKAALPGIETLTQFYNFANNMLSYIPTTSEVDPAESQFYHMISNSPNDILKTDSEFKQWLNEFTVELGKFMDTVASADNLDEFIDDPAYNIQDYYKEPSGWLTFNQFLARRVKSGTRPIEDLCSNNVIISTTDSVYLGQWPVHNAKVITKGTSYSVIDLLTGSAYQDKFKEGIFTHIYP